MGGGASISAETEMSTFKEMRAKFEELKTEGKTDEDIYAELKTLYNNSAGAAAETPAAVVANGDVEKPAAAPDAEASPAPEAESPPPAGETPQEVPAAAAAVAPPAEGEAAPTPVEAETPTETPTSAAAETPAPEAAAPPEATATAE